MLDNVVVAELSLGAEAGGGIPAPEIATTAFRGIAWSSLQNLASNGMGFVTYAFLARLLSPGDFGLLAFAAVFLAFLSLFIEQGIPDAIVQRASVRPGHLNAAFWCNLSVSFVLAGAMCLAAEVIGKTLHEPRLAPLLRGMAPLLIISALGGIQQAILKRNLQFKQMATQAFAANLCGAVLAVVLAWRGFGVASLVAQQLAIAAISAAAFWKFSHWRPGVSFSLQDLRDLLHFSLHLTGSAFLDFFNRRADDFLIGIFLGTTALGYYSLGYKLLLTFTRLVNSPFNSVAFPAFSRLQDRPDELGSLFYRLVKVTTWIAAPLFLGTAAASPDFIAVFFGKHWLAASPVLTILCFIGILHAIAFLHGSLLRACNRAAWQMWFTLCGALTNLIGFCCLVRWGVAYVAGWYVLSAYLWLGMDLYLLKKVLGHRTRDYLREFSAPMSNGLGMALVILAVRVYLPADLPAVSRLTLELMFGAVFLLLLNYPALGKCGQVTAWLRPDKNI